ncbi:type VI secretion system-associated protein TagF [Pseudoduganella sp. RAF19]|uniref:type VI secretion system-associated protein TagF n=1 Tax=Pseudoduganella sp. RAF19 TaxID=3233052 RepID=UPI003F974914
MSRMPTPAAIGYFGKVPSRADFVKGGSDPRVINVLDDWLARSMEMLSADARWKLTYDAVQPLHFALLGPRRRSAIAGHITASSDQSSRRFPFLMVSSVEVEEPASFASFSPLLLTRLWARLEQLSGGVLAAPDAGAPLQALQGNTLDLELRAAAYDAAFADFLELQTVGALDGLLAQAGFGGTVRQLMLALGMLLQPVMASSSSRLEKSLVLPLPADALYRNLVAAFWMHVITPFLMRADFELSLFVTRLHGKPVLVLGFSGASPHTLLGIMDPQVGEQHHIRFDDVEWVEDQVKDDYASQKVSAYLAQPALSLKSARDSLRTAFIGN